MSFIEDVDKVVSWNMSLDTSVDVSQDQLKSLWKLSEEQVNTLYTIILVSKVKIKGKQYARPFVWNRSITGKARVEEIANKIDNGNYEFSFNLTGIGEPTE